jgi:hypothetical protein
MSPVARLAHRIVICHPDGEYAHALAAGVFAEGYSVLAISDPEQILYELGEFDADLLVRELDLQVPYPPDATNGPPLGLVLEEEYGMVPRTLPGPYRKLPDRWTVMVHPARVPIRAGYIRSIIRGLRRGARRLVGDQVEPIEQESDPSQAGELAVAAA